MKLLDLFCGAGGAAMGYYYSGFTEIVGVDIEPQPNYPFDFIQADLADMNFHFGRFDLVHASPPCQRFSTASGKSDRRNYPDLLRPIRQKLISLEAPYVIENVLGAPLNDPLTLCGTLFPSLRVLRHRLFEASFPIPQPYLKDLCYNHPRVYRSRDKGRIDPHTSYVTVAGGGNCPLEAAQTAMGIDWMNQRELSQAIPPAYTSWIGNWFMIYFENEKRNMFNTELL
jgi:DNA (cytosine-5)-methyltransferase 1